MDLTRLLIFAVVFVAFLIVVRRLFSSDEAYLSPQGLEPPSADDRNSSRSFPPVLTGSEIPFPIKVPPVEYLGDGSYNRPIVKNYYFGKIDLVHGPGRRDAFCDDLFVQLEDPDSGHAWENQYTVATPAGLQEQLKSVPAGSLFLVGKVLIVAHWDLADILKQVMDDILENHEIATLGEGGEPDRMSE